MREYAFAYPYSWTILTLLLINCAFLVYYRKKIEWDRYLKGLGTCVLLGTIQIHGMENLPNVLCWYFPKGSAFLNDIGWKLGNIAFEDILFIPSCYSLFYCWLFYTDHKKWFACDPIGKNIYLRMGFIVAFIIIEAALGQAGGVGCRVLINYYTFPVIAGLVLYCRYRKVKLNITHMFSAFVFVMLINCGWDFVNAELRHWVYVKQCELLSKMGWFYKDRLHIAIFFQYGISGFFIVYACWVIFKREREITLFARSKRI